MNRTALSRLACPAVVCVFAANGFLIASLFSRMPAIQKSLDVDVKELGLLLLASSFGSLGALPFSDYLVRHRRPAGAVRFGATVSCLGVLLVAASPHSRVAFAVGLFAFGVGNSVWDVAMNVEAAQVGRRHQLETMSWFHAAFSFGTAVGAGMAAVTAFSGLGPSQHLPLAVATVVVAVFLGTARFRADERRRTRRRGLRGIRTVLDAWRDPVTLVLGLTAFSLAFVEGSADTWISLAATDSYRATDTFGAICLGVFVTAMTFGRLLGPRVLKRHGRVWVLRSGAMCALGGLVLLVWGVWVAQRSPHLGEAVACVAAAAWGLGASMGMPIAMSAAADDRHAAASRVSVVATFGYTALFVGPPLVGWIADHRGVANALLLVMGPLVLVLFTAGSTRVPRMLRS